MKRKFIAGVAALVLGVGSTVLLGSSVDSAGGGIWAKQSQSAGGGIWAK